jgi:diaminopimelate epimerase
MKFHKLSGSGNDFVLIDNRGLSLSGDLTGLVRGLCARRTGVGADGVLLLEPAKGADFRMRYLNADGGEVEFCGNGGRCSAYMARRLGLAGDRMTFLAGDGHHKAEVTGERVKLGMSDPRDISLGFLLEVDGRGYAASFADTGVPHVVIQVGDVGAVDVAGMGRAIRHHHQYAPRGTNANFVEVVDRRRLKVRTYERGVEDETLACGTGCTAAAVVAVLRGLADPPVECLTRGGEVLTVHLSREGQAVADVFLEGEVKLVFEGEWMSPIHIDRG